MSLYSSVKTCVRAPYGHKRRMEWDLGSQTPDPRSMKLLTFIHNRKSEICTGGHHNKKILSEAYVLQGSTTLTRIQRLPREQLRTMLSKSMRSIQRLAAGKQSLFRAGSNFSTNSLTIDLGEVFSTHRKSKYLLCVTESKQMTNILRSQCAKHPQRR